MTSIHHLPLAVLMLLLAGPGCSNGTDSQAQAPEPDAGAAGSSDAAIDSPFTGTMQCGNVPVANPTCAACADTNCCTQGNDCAAHQDCLDLRDCRRGCAAADTACQSSCEAQHPEGASFDAALTACRMHQCADACFAGADVTCGFSVSPSACQTCAESVCCEVGYAANLQPVFWDYLRCIRACHDDACFQACASDHPKGQLIYATWLGCLGTSCASECQISPSYTCGANYAAPCDTCVAASCCAQSTACYQDADCVGIDQCAKACGADSACVGGCQTGGEADAKWTALRSCLTGACAGSCGQ